MRSRSLAYATKNMIVSSSWQLMWWMDWLNFVYRMTTCIHYCQDRQGWRYVRQLLAIVWNGCMTWQLGTPGSNQGRFPRIHFDSNRSSRDEGHSKSMYISGATISLNFPWMTIYSSLNGSWIGGWKRTNGWNSSTKKVDSLPSIMATTMVNWTMTIGFMMTLLLYWISAILMVLIPIGFPYDFSIPSRNLLVFGFIWFPIFLSYISFTVWSLTYLYVIIISGIYSSPL